MAALKDKQLEIFCYEFLIDSNLSKAYQRTKKHYGKDVCSKTASNYAHKWFKKKEVQERINELFEERERKLGLDAYQVVRELQKLAFSRVSDVIEYDGLIMKVKSFDKVPQEALDAIQSMKQTFNKDGEPIIEVKFYSKLDALNTLSRHHGLLNEKLEITHKKTLEDYIREAKEEELKGEK